MQIRALSTLLPTLLITAGGICALVGLYLLVGLAWTLLGGGLVAVAYGEAADFRRGRRRSG